MVNIKHYESPKYKINSKGGVIIGETNIMLNLFNYLNILANKPTTVLLHGETGTGKDLCARALHYNSEEARGGEFVAVNCDSINSELLESELFGHVKGSFTGAYQNYSGKFMHANKGTIFLDEIGEMSKDMQSKLLRVLQEKIIMPVGSNEQKEVNVRIIAATNRNLEEEVSKGNFRKDLYYRLNIAPIRIPSVIERKEDIPLITEYFIEVFNSEYKTNIEGITDVARGILKAHQWRGNIRELRSIIERAFLFREEGLIDEDDLIFGSEIPNINFMKERKIYDLVGEEFEREVEILEKDSNKEKELLDVKRVKEIRRNAGLTLEALAKGLGIKGGSAYMSLIERGKFKQESPKGSAKKYETWLISQGYDYRREAGLID